MDCQLANAWIIEPKKVEDNRGEDMVEREFVSIHMQLYRCKNFLKNGKAMVNHIIELRNKKVKELMRALPREEDPNDFYASSDAAPIRPRREMIDQISRVITVKVVSSTGFQASVNVMATWRERDVLTIELTAPNLDLLLEDPPAGSAPWAPEINEPDVQWVSCRRELRTSYWDSQKGRQKTKSQQVELDQDDKQTACDKLRQHYKGFLRLTTTKKGTCLWMRIVAIRLIHTSPHERRGDDAAPWIESADTFG